MLACVFAHHQAAVVRACNLHTKGVALAVGDGGNDCAMIREADVGVGVQGKEGLQAFNVSRTSHSHIHDKSLTQRVLPWDASFSGGARRAHADAYV